MNRFKSRESISQTEPRRYARRWRTFSVFLAAALCAQFSAPVAHAADTFDIKLPGGQQYALSSSNELRRLTNDLATLIRDEERILAARKAERKRLREQTPLAEMSFDQLEAYFDEPLDLPTNNELRGLIALQQLATAALHADSANDRTNELRRMMEVSQAVANFHRAPAPQHMDVALIPFVLLHHMHRPVGKGTTPAENVVAPASTDPGRIDPPTSSFWKPPPDIAKADLFHGFGRSRLPDFTNVLWKYDEPKTSFGANPGFELEHGRQKVKVKFGELHSEPFAARIFHALGYNADPTDYAPSLRIKYDRRLFREFHMRKELKLKVTVLLFIPAPGVSLQHRHDPFDHIACAVLKDGTRWSGKELKRRLFHDSRRDHPEDEPENFIAAIEEQIDYLLTKPANVQLRDDNVQSIGPWKFGGLGHENLRELRGMTLLAAWIGWFDSRSDNTRLKFTTNNGAIELRHYVSDLGGGFGKSVGLFSWDSENLDEFPWRFTKPAEQTPASRLPSATEAKPMVRPFRIMNYRPIVITPAFREMTEADARWMARMIGRLREEQIVQALVASGFASAEVRLLAEKLVVRRDRMIRDLKLEDEIPLLRSGGVKRQFNYNPATEGPVETILSNGEKASAPVSNKVILKGRLIERDDEHDNEQ